METKPGTENPPPARPGPEVPPPPEPEAPARPRRKKRWGRIALVVLPLLIIGGVLYYWFFSRPYESTDDAFIEGDIVPIAPRVPGQVAKRFVDDNQVVKQGDELVEIDPRDYEARLAQAQASLAAARTRLQQAKAQLASANARVEEERANLVSAETEAERAQADLKRYQSVQSPAVSRTQLDLATAQARSNAAAVDVARNRIKAAEAQVALGQAGILTAEADVQMNQASLRQAELQVSYTKVTAPEAGFVTHRTVEAGAYVQAGQALLALVPLRLYVTANFKETQLKHMQPGQPVEIHVDAYPQHTFRGHVDSIQRGSGARFSLLPPENATGN
jgi:membrane fusion protein, multidrug efflux system